jgi:Ca-activated chloride channel family protein
MTRKVISAIVTLIFAVLCIVLVHRLATRDSATDDNDKTPVRSMPKGSLALQFYSSSAKKTWIDEVTGDFNQQRNRVDGRTIHVNVTHVTSGGSLRNIIEGKIQPDLWSPGEGSWVKLANNHWQNVYSRPFIRNTKDVVNVPLIIAMWEPMARALGYPNKPLGWKDIAEVAANPKGWAAYGHQEWGKFRWGHAHAEANSGFLTVLSEVYSCLGKTENMTVEDLKAPGVKRFLKTAESAVEHYGMSNSWLDEQMRTKGPGYLSAVTQYENAIIESNRTYGSKPFKLVAIYPKEGAFWTRHPAGIPDADWVTPEKRKAAELYIDYLLQQEVQRKAMEIGLRPISQKIPLEEPFTPEYGVQARIDTSRIFHTPDEQVLRRVRELWEESKMPASVVVLLDISGSMQGSPLEYAKKGAATFIEKMNKWDELEVITFNHQLAKLADLDRISANGEKARQKIQNLFADGGTCLFDAMQSALETVQKRRRVAPNRRYGIVLLSDGDDTNSETGKYDFLDDLPRGDSPDVIRIYTIAYGEEANRDLLIEIAKSTNARMFKSLPEDIEKVYRELSANF